jgi:hypothetical protein
MILVGIGWWFVSSASAGTLAIGASPTDAADRAAEAGAPAPIRGAAPGELVGSGNTPRAFGAGQPAPCAAGIISNLTVQEALDRAASLMAYAKLDEAKVELQPAIDRLACLSEPAVPSTLAKVFYYQGVIATASGDAAAGERAFRRALAFEPSLSWDDMFVPEYGESTFTALRSGKGLGSSELYVTSDLLAGHQVWVDGRPRPGPAPHLVSKGDHLVQLIGPTVRTFEITADSPVVIAVPSKVASDWLPAESAPPVELGIVASAAASPGDAIYAFTGRQAWRLDGGRWTAVSEGSVAEDRGGKRRSGLPLVAGGAVAAGSGAVCFQIATSRGWAWRDAYADAPPGSAAATESLENWETARTAQYAYGALAMGGLALTFVGVGVQLSDGHGVTAVPFLVDGGGGAGLGGRF